MTWRRGREWTLALLMVVGVFGMARGVEAAAIILDNYRDQKVSVALYYYDTNEGSWCCQGWWGVEAGGERTITVPHDPGERIYYYVQAGGKAVHKRSEGWSRQHVVDDAFKYYEHDGCPDGTNYRAVYFNGSKKTTGKSWRLRIN